MPFAQIPYATSQRERHEDASTPCSFGCCPSFVQCAISYVRQTLFGLQSFHVYSKSPDASIIFSLATAANALHINSAVKTFRSMPTTLKEQAWQSGLVLKNETAEWNQNHWPPLVGGAREYHTSVVLNHLDTDKDSNSKRQTVVVLGGYQADPGSLDSVLLLNLADPDMQWREGPPMNKSREGHAAVVCNGGIYVIGGFNIGSLDCMERIDAKDILQLSLTTSSTHEIQWTTLTCRLSTQRRGCCAVAVHNRYIVVVGGWDGRQRLSSVDIIDTRNHTVTVGPSMTVPRRFCTSAFIGHRIFVVGGQNDDGYLDSVEYLDLARPCGTEKTKEDSANTFISFSPTWTTHSELLSIARSSCAMVAVGSCLVVAGGWRNSTVEVLDTHRNRVWNLPPFGNHRDGCSMVTVANQLAVIGGRRNPSCATLPLMDRNSWCFRRLCEQQLSGWHLFREGMDISSFSTSTSKSE